MRATPPVILARLASSTVTRVLAKLEPGGAQLSVLWVIRGLRDHELDSRLLVGWASEDGLALAGAHGVAVEVFGEAGDLQWRPDRRFAAWLRPRVAGASVVHAHMFGAWWAAAQVVDDATVLVASEHNDLTWPNGRPAAALAPALARVDRFFAHGPGARRSVLAAGLPAPRLRAGVSPIDDVDAVPRPGLPVPRIVFAGRLHAEKGPDVLLEALALLPDAAPALILGDGPLRGVLEARIAEADLGDRVTLCGWQERPAPWIAGAGALVVPSRHEAWSQTAVLGMALGTPVIGTDVDGLPETLGEGRGVVVAPEDPAALAAAIADVLAGRRPTDREGARRYARGFTVPQVSATYADVYRELRQGDLAAADEA